MIGEIEDPHFEAHLREGPYVVFDDAALPRYKNDSRVHFVPGHPVLPDAMPELMKGLGVKVAGQGMMQWDQFERWGMHNLQYGDAKRRALTIAEPLAAVALAAVAGFALSALVGRVRSSGAGSAGGEKGRARDGGSRP